MPVFRTDKRKGNFTSVDNKYLFDNTLSISTKGLFTIMLSLPEDWDFSINGLSKLSGKSHGTIKKLLNELEKSGYLERKKLSPAQTLSGRYEYVYYIYERSRNKTRDKKQGGCNTRG